MNKNIVSLDISRLLKHKGFNIPVLYYYDGCDMIASQAKNVFDFKNYNKHGGSTFRSAPFYEQVIDWLESKHGIHFNIMYTINITIGTGYIWGVIEMPELDNKVGLYCNKIDALEEGLYYLLNNIKN